MFEEDSNEVKSETINEPSDEASNSSCSVNNEINGNYSVISSIKRQRKSIQYLSSKRFRQSTEISKRNNKKETVFFNILFFSFLE